MKRLFQVGLAILIVGLIALGVGGFSHGNKAVSFEGTKPVIVNKTWTRSKVVNKEFHQINADLSSADVTIVRGNKFQIIYHGKNVPKIQVKNGQATIKQDATDRQVGFHWSSSHYGNDTVTIVVPKGVKLSGRLSLSQGDLYLNNVELDQLTSSIDEGDVAVNNVNANSSQFKLSEGDFRAHRLTVHHHCKVVNDEGDNTVRGVSAEGYYLRTDEGDNSLFHQEQDGEDQTVLQKNSHATNVLTLISSEGDNSIH